MLSKLKNSPLFAGMSERDIAHCLACSGSELTAYAKDELIFRQQDEPKNLLVLVDGTVVVCNDSSSGKRSIIATLDQPGELFGEVFVFLNRGEFDHYAQAATDAQVLRMPKEFFYHTCGDNCGYHTQLISNMLAILAQKAYYLNQKLQILSHSTLRQKIAAILLQNAAPDGRVALSLNREELADFLNTARPSLSRELMKMQQDGLIKTEKKNIFITDFAAMWELL